jgi:hypothetical protein
MVIDKKYFLDRLANGEDMDVIGQEMAAMMNAAMAEHNANLEAEAAKQAEAEKEAAKRDLIEELVEIIQELAILEGMDPDEMTISDEEMDQLVAAFTEMFAAMRDLKKMFAGLEAKLESDKVPVKLHHSGPAAGRIVPVAKSDEQILADFIKMFN